jgi:Tol biopolymer transport system component/DNA-binding winged helix-turn-helix (wHTH) protein
VITYRFAGIELDIARFTVTRGGERLPLEPKAIDVLRVLVERRGHLVTKDELLDAVWPGVAVTPNALTRVVAQLRRELGDDASAARFIETVPTRGYRFIAEVEAVGADPGPGRATTPAPEPAVPQVDAPPWRLSRWGWAVATVLAIAIAAGLTLRRPAAGSSAAFAAVADESGSILDVAYAPTGRWLAVVSDRAGDFEIYLRELDTGTSRPLTADGMRNVHPAWSPDGTRLAFHSARRGGIWVIGVDGGPARQIAPSGSRPAWSPDGRWLAYQSDEWVTELAQPGSHLMLVPVDGSAAPRPLTAPGDPPGGHGAPHWTADGATVYFTAARNGPTDLWSVRVRDGLLVKRADDWKLRVLALTDGAEGPAVWAVEPWRDTGRLVRVPVGDGRPSAPAVILDALPAGVRAASVAPGGRRAALVFVEAAEDVWTVPVTAAGAPAGDPRRLSAGGHPAISPDGQWVAYDHGAEIRVRRIDGSGERTVVAGGRRAMYPIWRDDRRLLAIRLTGLTPYLIEADLETGAVTERLRLPEATSFPRLAPDGDTVIATLGEPLNRLGRGSLTAGTFAEWPLFDGYSFAVWSPDGRRLAVEKKVGPHMPAYLADPESGAVSALTAADGQYWPGSFSPDGRALALGVLDAGGTWDIEVLDVDSRQRRTVARAGTPETVLRYPSWSPRGGLIAYNRYLLRGSLHTVDFAADPRPITR